MSNKFRLAAILILLRFHPSIGAATLKPETKAAWDAYLQAANAAMQARLQPGAHFLWLDDEPDRAEEFGPRGLTLRQSAGRFQRKFRPDSSMIGLVWALSLTRKSKTSC